MMFQVREDDLPAVQSRYEVDPLWQMERMVANRGDLKLPKRPDVSIRRLSEADIPRARDLYALWPDAAFSADMLRDATFYGAFAGNALLAAAGTHAYSVRRQIATIGAVFTHPDHRGQGLATAVTGTLAQVLVAQGIEDLALNVNADNEPAIAAYSRLGFRRALPFVEGAGILQEPG
jgi:predicted GNAT family acetyltransferase